MAVVDDTRRKKKPYHLLLENNTMGADYRSFQFQISPRTVPREAVIAPTSMAKGSETSISNQPGSSTFITSGGSHITGARACAITGGTTTAGTAITTPSSHTPRRSSFFSQPWRRCQWTTASTINAQTR